MIWVIVIAIQAIVGVGVIEYQKAHEDKAIYFKHEIKINGKDASV